MAHSNGASKGQPIQAEHIESPFLLPRDNQHKLLSHNQIIALPFSNNLLPQQIMPSLKIPSHLLLVPRQIDCKNAMPEPKSGEFERFGAVGEGLDMLLDVGGKVHVLVCWQDLQVLVGLGVA